MTTMQASDIPRPAGWGMQANITQNIDHMLTFRGLSKRALARHLHIDPAGVTARFKAETAWRTTEVEEAAQLLGVPWHWLTLPLPELMAKVTTPPGPDGSGLTPRYVDSGSQRRRFAGPRTSVTRPRERHRTAAPELEDVLTAA